MFDLLISEGSMFVEQSIEPQKVTVYNIVEAFSIIRGLSRNSNGI